MKIKQFTKLVSKHSIKNKDVFFSMNALAGELGELANVIKKEQFYTDFSTYADRVDKEIKENKRSSFRDMTIDEAGDTFFYFIQVLNKKGITLKEVMEYQQLKLKKQGDDSKLMEIVNSKIFKK